MVTAGRLEGRVALITGAASGIGRAIAERFAREGAAIVVGDIDEAAGPAAVAALEAEGGRALFQPLDVGDPASAAAAAQAAADRFGRLDIHVNNAGITNRANFLDYPLEQWERILRINLTGAFLCGQASARLMAKAGSGRIINIASVSGQQGGTGRAAYGASKAAIINLTQTMAMELAPFGITANAIAPGPTQVSRLSHGPRQREAFLSRMAIKRYATPAEIGAAAVFLASEDAAYITGHVLNVDGGFKAAGVLFDPKDGL